MRATSSIVLLGWKNVGCTADTKGQWLAFATLLMALSHSTSSSEELNS